MEIKCMIIDLGLGFTFNFKNFGGKRNHNFVPVYFIKPFEYIHTMILHSKNYCNIYLNLHLFLQLIIYFLLLV